MLRNFDKMNDLDRSVKTDFATYDGFLKSFKFNPSQISEQSVKSTEYNAPIVILTSEDGRIMTGKLYPNDLLFCFKNELVASMDKNLKYPYTFNIFFLNELLKTKREQILEKYKETAMAQQLFNAIEYARGMDNLKDEKFHFKKSYLEQNRKDLLPTLLEIEQKVELQGVKAYEVVFMVNELLVRYITFLGVYDGASHKYSQNERPSKKPKQLSIYNDRFRVKGCVLARVPICLENRKDKNPESKKEAIFWQNQKIVFTYNQDKQQNYELLVTVPIKNSVQKDKKSEPLEKNTDIKTIIDSIGYFYLTTDWEYSLSDDCINIGSFRVLTSPKEKGIQKLLSELKEEEYADLKLYDINLI
jgi:hypothetical protein